MSKSAIARCTPEWRRIKSELYRTKIDDDKLRELYEKENKTQVECSIEMGVSVKVISNAMRRIGIKPRRATKRDQWGQKNHQWRGNKASLSNKHRRLYRILGQPNKCDVCGIDDEEKWYDWENLTGDYDDPSDFARMCRPCHRKYDNSRRAR
jgi:hypothetical protein